MVSIIEIQASACRRRANDSQRELAGETTNKMAVDIKTTTANSFHFSNSRQFRTNGPPLRSQIEYCNFSCCFARLDPRNRKDSTCLKEGVKKE
jgi:hypothetical protein